MATLQIKHLPDGIHRALKDRAKANHLTLSDYTTQVLAREVSKPSMAQWLQEVVDHPVVPTGPVDSAELVRAIRRQDKVA